MTRELKKFYILVIFFALINSFLIYLIFFLFRLINNNSQVLLKNKEKISILAKESEDFEKIKVFYQNHQEDFKKIENMFIDSEAPIDFISFLEKTAQDCQLQLKINSLIKNQEKEKNLSFLSFQISIQGSFSNFLKFIDKIENGPYLIDTVDLSVQSAKEENLENKEFQKENQIFLTIKVISK